MTGRKLGKQAHTVLVQRRAVFAVGEFSGEFCELGRAGNGEILLVNLVGHQNAFGLDRTCFVFRQERKIRGQHIPF